jgi:hypothetical protein
MDYHFHSALVARESRTSFVGGTTTALVRALNRARREERDRERGRALDRALGRARGGALDRDRDLDRARALARARARARDRDRDRDRNRALDRDRTRALDRDRTRALDRDRDRDRDLEQALDRARAREGAHVGPSGWWKEFQTHPDLCGPVLDLLVEVLDLKPELLWWEFLRVCVLPTLPGRLRTYDAALWERTTTRIEAGATDLDLWWAAHHLLTDSALWIAEVYKQPSDSPAAKLARLTREINFPALRIVHCLRDLAYGDEARTDDLVNFVKSRDPEYQKFFRDSYWID